MKIFTMGSMIILDMDDTLVSTHYRQYSCINDYLLNAGSAFITYDSYVDLRRANQFSNTQLLKSLHTELDWENFSEYYLKNIESEKYLSFDTLIVEKQLLAYVNKKNYKLVLLSIRSNHQNSLRQLQNLGIDVFFSEIFFEYHDLGTNPKLNRLQQLQAVNKITSFCGDSLSDYEAAERLNINFAQVRTSLYQLQDFKHAVHFNTINQFLSSLP